MSTFNIDDYIAQLSIDCVIFGFKDGELKVLVSKLTYGDNLWCLPGGYILKTESVDAAAARILKKSTGLDNIYLEQFRVFGDENRILQSKYKENIRQGLLQLKDKRFDEKTIAWMANRFVCIGYYALVDINKVDPKPGEFGASIEWRSIDDLPNLTHDHDTIVSYGLKALRQNLDEKLIGFNLLPKTFTMKEVKELYEAVHGTSFAMNNFQKKILELNVLERLGKKFTGAQNRAPFLYQFKEH
ncbi:NrtR DNA-binding winged helix domain-containing protein [Allomuricauda sp. NBRC 101325]|uniref:NUDIX hydrolase n=1 Tax=Allomuricauda sp. NBRC 101325 TaxID=1113758 RepID=UPI0024A060E8|nr:NUDIX domain-containing protein [Muricauda sp. NBRC 101325]GLU44576.1 DNA mismatch repair protein MutT [Muricauda sp. NBRC 101325]